MRLHHIIHNHGGILWCGHAAMATITGRSTKDCLPYLKQSAKELDLHHGMERRLRGIYAKELTRALMYFGFDCKLIHDCKLYEQLPNNSLLDHSYKLNPGKVYLVIVPNHYVVCQGNIMIDNFNREGIRIADCRRKDQPVLAIWEVSELQAKDL